MMKYEDWVIARVEENKFLFSNAELKMIYTNIEICKKIYMIAVKNVSFLQ